jgi:hypothetical protein
MSGTASNNPAKTALPGIGGSYAVDGTGQTGTPEVMASGVTPGSYNSANITVSASGQVIAATSGAGPGTGAPNTLAGYNNTGLFSGVTLGTNLTLSGGVLNATGGSGSGTVTNVATGTGLTGGPITTTGTIAIATSTANTLAGYNSSGVFSDVAIGSNLTLSGGTLSATGGSGTPGGSTGQVQYNNAGAFGGLTNTQLTADINVFTNGLSGAVPASGGGTTNFLRADGTFAVPAGSGGGTVTTTGSPVSGNLAAFSGATAITNGNLSGDITTSGTLAATLATVNSNVGSFTNANITVNAKGLITAAANGSAGTGTVTSVGTSTGLTGGPITTFGTISMATSTSNSLAGYNNSGTFSTVTIGSGLTLASGVLSNSGGSVSTGTINQTAYYASAGTVISGIGPGVANAPYVSNGAGSPPGFQTTNVQIDSTQGVITSDTFASTVTFNLATSNWHTLTLTGNATLALSNPSVGQQFSIILLQDGTGSRLVTWFSGILWPSNVAPTLTTTANKRDVFTFKCISTGVYLGFIAGQNM